MSFLGFLLEIGAEFAYWLPMGAADRLAKRTRTRVMILLTLVSLVIGAFFLAAYLNVIGVW